MNGQRRHANDFTDSLNSFRQVSEEQDEDVFEACLQDSLVTDSIKNGQYEDNYNVTKNDTGSIILAGNFARQQSDSFETIQGNCINTYKAGQPVSKDILIVSDETLYLPLKPDLNKCINLFHNEYLKECDDTKKLNISSSLSELRIDDDIELNKNKSSIVQLIRDCRRSVSSDSFKSITTPPNVEIRKCKSCTMLNSNLKRDTNYNIKSDKLFSTEAVIKSNQDRVDLKFISLYDQFSLPQTPVLQKESEERQEPDSSSQRSLKEELDPSELRAFLQSLDDKKPTEEPEQERLLRRLSITYYDSPKHFTERLLTIIEESTESQANVSLCRLLEEFQKCNYIEDETAPEWLHSSPGMSTSIRMRKGSQEFKRDLLRKSLGAATPNKDFYPATPISPRLNINSPYKIYRHPKSILYNVGSPLLDNTSTFESLEAYCEKLYPNEYKTLATAERNQWQSPLRNKNRILRACENQMASLENSPNIRDQLKARRSSLDSVIQRNTVPEALCRLLSCEHKTDLKSVPDIFKQRTEHNKHNERIKQDKCLRHSLIHEIAKKRQKCIDTVKMMETDMNSERVQETCQITTNSKCNSSTGNNDTKFMKTLECVKKYQDYLEQSKPFLNLLQQSESYSSHTHDKKDTPTKKISNKNINTDITVVSPSKTTLKVPKSSPRTRKKSTSPSSLKPSSANKIIFSKPKLFYTPGKTTPQVVVKNGKPKRTYFPNLLNSTSKQKENVSPHEKNYYRQCGTYDYVKSPVGSYIRGTDPYLVKNLRPKTDENLLTPRKKKTNRSPSPKPKMKIRLSPKESSTRTPVRDEDTADNFLYPKVNYKLPLHVRTIKENSKAGNRVNQLLRSTQDKVVIRHEGRTKSVQTNCSEQPEIHYDSAEESVHIEQTARKTYSCRMQKK